MFWYQIWLQLWNKKPTSNMWIKTQIPQQQMMSYNIEDVDDELYGVSKPVAQKIKDFVASNAKSWWEKETMLADMHQEAIKYEQSQAFMKDRLKQKSILATSKDNNDIIALKLANFADTVRMLADKQWFNAINIDDQQLINKHLEENPQQEKLFLDYMNGNIWNTELWKELWLLDDIPQPEIETEDETRSIWWVKAEQARLWLDFWWAEKWINPIWKLFEEVDNLIQKIPTVWWWMEDKFNQKIASLTDEQLNKYKESYEKSKFAQKLYSFEEYVKAKEKTLWEQIMGVGEKWPSIAKMYSNIPSSTLKTASWISRAVTNPFDTLVWLWNLIFTKEWRQLIIDRYWTVEWFTKTLEEDPVWLASDVLTLIEWWAWALWTKAIWLWEVAVKLPKTKLPLIWEIWWDIWKIWDVWKIAGETSMLWIKTPITKWLDTLSASVKWVPVIWPAVDLAVWLTRPVKFIKTLKRGWDVSNIKLTEKDWNYKDWLTALQSDRTIRKLWNYITPDYNKKQSADLTKKVWTSKEKIWGKTYLVPTEYDMPYIDVASKYTDLSKSVDANIANYKKWIEWLWKNIQTVISNDKNTVKYGKIRELVDWIEKSVEIVWDAEKIVDKWMDKFYDILDKEIAKEWNNNMSVYNARKKYRDYLSKETTAFKNPDLAKNRYLISIWNAINEYLTDTYWDKYSIPLKEQAILYKLLDNTAAKSTQLKTTDLWRFVKKYENEIKAGAYWLWLWYAWVMWFMSLWD